MKSLRSLSPMGRRFLKDLSKISNYLILVLAPILLLPLILATNRTEALKCAYVVLLMAIYWLTSALPIAVTALLPVILFPVMGLIEVKNVAKNYITETSFVLLGGLMMALAVERSNFHKRLALRVLLLMGTKPIGILLGVMLPTWILSMWISNTATTSMMLPISAAIVQQLGEGVRRHKQALTESSADNPGYVKDVDRCEDCDDRGQCDGHDNDCDACHEGDKDTCVDDFSDTQSANMGESAEDVGSNNDEPEVKVHDGSNSGVKDGETTEEGEDQDIDKMLMNFEKMLSLGVAYSATVGGTATLTGTPPNLVFADLANRLYAAHGRAGPITFASWALFGLPHAIICLILTVAWLQFFYLGIRSCCFCFFRDQKGDKAREGVAKAIRSQYESLGKMTFAEISTLFFFVLLVVLWFTREPGAFAGYSSLFKQGYLTDGVPAVFVAILLFAFPSERPQVFCLRNDQGETKRPKEKALLPDWEYVSSRLAWGPIIIMGGGIALAEGCEKSGLSKMVGDQLGALNVLPPWLMVLLIVAIVAMLTEVTSNTAVITLVTPMLFTMASNLGLNPLYLTLPATMASSYAFMLPVATPVNALVFADGKVTVLDMVKAGFAMNIACILVVTLGVHTWAGLAFGINDEFWTYTLDRINGTNVNFTTAVTPA